MIRFIYGRGRKAYKLSRFMFDSEAVYKFPPPQVQIFGDNNKNSLLLFLVFLASCIFPYISLILNILKNMFKISKNVKVNPAITLL